MTNSLNIVLDAKPDEITASGQRDIQATLDRAPKTWWTALDNGDVWPCKVLSLTPFGTRVEITHGNDEHYESIAGKTFILDRQRVYDGSFNHPTREDVAA